MRPIASKFERFMMRGEVQMGVDCETRCEGVKGFC